MPHVFISYSRTDQDYARKLAEDLRQHGFDVWVDNRSIGPGTQWWDEIEQAIVDCGAFVIIMTPESRQSEWVNLEILNAKNEGKPIFPVLLKGSVFRILLNIQHIDVHGGKLPGQDFYARLESVLQPADESGVMVAPELPQEAPPVAEESLSESDTTEAFEEIVEPQEIVEEIPAPEGEIAELPYELALPEVAPPVDDAPPFESEITEAIEEPTARDAIEAYPAPKEAPPPQPEMAQSQQQAAPGAPRGLLTMGALLAVIVIAVLAGIFLLGGDTDTPVPLAIPDLAAREAAETGVSSNSEWTPRGEDFDGVEMVLVPAGCFMMGSEDGEEDERPEHEQCFEEPFWIDRFEVTNEQYGSLGCEQSSSEPDQPRNCVDWFEARAHCEGRSARLPTEHEWEYAARGPDNWVYPWGDNVIGDNVVYIGNSNNRSAVVGSKPTGTSWVGAMDMSGNLWEWASTIYEVYPYTSDREDDNNTDSRRVLRGGSFYNTTSRLRAANRVRSIPDYDNSIINGFRCARDY